MTSDSSLFRHAANLTLSRGDEVPYCGAVDVDPDYVWLRDTFERQVRAGGRATRYLCPACMQIVRDDRLRVALDDGDAIMVVAALRTMGGPDAEALADRIKAARS